MSVKRLQFVKLLLAGSVGAVVYAATPLANPRVRQLGSQLLCKCGCGASVTECNMMQCHISEPIRERLLALVTAGKSDQAILDEMVQTYGQDILLKPPAQGFYMLGWVMPWVGLAAGLGLLWMLVQHYLKPKPSAATANGAPAAPVSPEDSPELKKYKAQIERDLADLDS